jgi:hypothetical protein
MFISLFACFFELRNLPFTLPGLPITHSFHSAEKVLCVCVRAEAAKNAWWPLMFSCVSRHAVPLILFRGTLSSGGFFALLCFPDDLAFVAHALGPLGLLSWRWEML